MKLDTGYRNKAEQKDAIHKLSVLLNTSVAALPLEDILKGEATPNKIIKLGLGLRGIVVPAHLFPDALRPAGTTLFDLQRLLPDKYFSKPIYNYIIQANVEIGKGRASDLSLYTDDRRDLKLIDVGILPSADPIMNVPGATESSGTW